MKALPPLPGELAEDSERGRMPLGVLAVLIVIPSLIFWGMAAAFFLLG